MLKRTGAPKSTFGPALRAVFFALRFHMLTISFATQVSGSGEVHRAPGGPRLSGSVVTWEVI